MKFGGYVLSIESWRFTFLLIFVIVLSASLVVSVVSAQNEKVAIGANVTAKANAGTSGIQANASSNASVKAEANATASSNTTSQEQYQGSTQAASQGHLNTSYSEIYANSDNTFTAQTNQHLYKPGDAVKVAGTIWSGLSATVGGINTVSIQITDDNGTTIYTGKQQVSNGEYSGSFELPADAKKGSYTVQMKADVNADVMNTLTLKTQVGLGSTAQFIVASPNALTVKAEGKDFDVNISSNSDVTDLKFDEQAKKLSFSVQGQSGTTGVTDITIPKSLLSGDFTVMLDGQVMSQNDVIETADIQDQTTLEINYHHSSHVIDIVGTNAVPEFPVSAVIMTIAVTSMIILVTFGNRIIKRN